MSRDSDKSSVVPLDDKEQLDLLPEKHREEILKQYDLPHVKVNLFTLLGYGTPLDFALQILGSVMATAAGAALPLMTILIGNLTNVFGAIVSPGAHGIGSLSSTEEFHQKVSHQALILVYIGIAVFFAVYVGTVCWIVTGERISRRIRIDYLRAVLRQNIAYFDRVGAGEITNRVSHDVDLIQDGISDKVALSLYSIGTFFSGFIVAFVRAWKFALILSCILPVLVIVIGGGGRLVAKASKGVMAGYSSAATIAEEVLSSVRTAQAFGTEDRLANTYDEKLASAQQAGYRKSFAMAFMMASIFSIRYLHFGLGFWEGSRLIASGDLNVGLLINVLFAVLVGSFSLAQLMPRIQSFISATSAAQKVFQTIHRIPSIDSLDDGGLRPDLRGDIHFTDVSFIYPSRPQVTVLKNVSFAIPEGKFTAIVGASGSGKSTIIHLLERFYDPVEGSLSINGHDLKTLNVSHLRSCIKVVSQEPTLFASSIFENICDGMTESVRQKTSEEEKRELVRKAAIVANADQFIQALPDGYNTIVGERGFLMSGGQKQRIAIARAIVSDPQILLLDEATSALDTTSERVVQEALDVAAASRTTVCVAHRLSTIRNADNIIVLSKGEVAEQGTHDELLAQNGMYANLVNAQFISSTADEEKTERNVEDEDLEKANIPLEGLKRTDTQGTIEEKEPEPPTYTNFQLVKKALRWNKGEYKWLTLGWACSIINAGSYPAQALLFAYLVTALLLSSISAMQSRADFLSIWWLVLAIVEFFALFVLNASFGYASEKMVRRVRHQSLRNITRQEIAYFDRAENSTGRLTNMLSQEATAMAGLSGNNLGTILTLIVDLVSVIILAIAYAWKLGLVAVALMPIQIFSGYFRFAMQRKLSDELRKAYAQSANMACEQVAAIRTVASLNREPYILEQFERSLEQPVHEAMVKTLKSTVFYAFSLGYQFFSLSLIFWYGSTLLVNGQYTITQFFVALMSITVGGNNAGMIIGFASDITKAKLGAISVTRLLERKPKIDSWSDEGYRIKGLESGHIVFQDVHFRYPSRPHVPVLRGFNMDVKPGQYVALVGASGCGKSTCVALIERFYDPRSGQILVDGIPVSDYHIADYRKCISLVSQEPALYQGTIRFNILLGSNEANPTDEALDEACREANILDFIQSLPEGYETMVGSKGMALSGGQKQRIAIARALIRNPRILLLDEATSSLDSESETVVQEAIDKAAQGRTTIAIAHRLSTIQKADIIYVLEGGVVVEKGRHDELVARRGRYYEMVKLQELSKVG